MKKLALDAGFQQAEIIPTKGHPAVFATLDAGAKHTLGLYFMYDVKQADPAEWSSPPWDAKLVEMPGNGTVLMGRGATNQKGPQAAFLAALHAIRGAGRKIPVNLVLVAEGEEEVGSPNFQEIVLTPRVRAALEKSVGIFMPSTARNRRQRAHHASAPRATSKCDLVATRRGLGPRPDARRPLQPGRAPRPARLATGAGAQHARDADRRSRHRRTSSSTCGPSAPRRTRCSTRSPSGSSETAVKEAIGVKVWARDANWRQALEDYVSRPTVTIEGLVGGYGGPGGKTILPTKMTAKLDMRLVPDMTPEDVMAKLKAHLDKRGYQRHRDRQERRLQLHVVDAGGFEDDPVATRACTRPTASTRC